MASPASPQFVTLLDSLRSSDNSLRSSAEKSYMDAQMNSPEEVLVSLLACMNPASCAEVLRTQAATLFRRAVVSAGTDSAWTKVGSQVQVQVRHMLFQLLESEPVRSVRKLLIAGVTAVADQMMASDGAWEELLPNILVLAESKNTHHQETALWLLSELMGTSYTAAILHRKEVLGKLVAAGLASVDLQAAALSLVAEMISSLDESRWSDMQPVLPMVEVALMAMAESSDSGAAFEDALTSLVASATECAGFFKPRLQEWVQMMLAFANARGTIEDGRRSLAFEWISSIAESKANLLTRVVPDFVQKVLGTAFAFLAEVEEDGSWEGIDEDEEEDDDDSLHKMGEAKVDLFVKTLGFASTKKALMALVQQYGTGSRWEEKFAVSMALRAAVEYVDDAAALDTAAALLLQLAGDGHMRVRYAALLALGQICHDQESEFHERWHARLIPALTQACADPVGRVAAMAAGALEAVIGDLDVNTLEEHARPVLEAFVSKLTSCSHTGVLIAVMEALGALAAGLEGHFEGYYDQLMSMLLAFVGKQEGQLASLDKLRGKAFECISCLGFAVGKERFAPAAKQTMAAMLANSQLADESLKDCIRESMERMCKIMGSDFAVFLPSLVPPILGGLDMGSVVTKSTNEEANDENDGVNFQTEQGLMKVKTSQIEEKVSTVGLLTVLVKETGEGFLPFAQPTAEALARILGCTDAVLHMASDIRDAVYPCWANLVATAASSPAQHSLVVELVQQFVDKVGADLVKAEDPEDIAPMARGIADVLRHAGSCLQPQQLQQMSDLALSEIMKSFQRESALKENAGALAEVQAATINVPTAQDEGDDDASDDVNIDKMDEDEEQDCRLGLSAIFGACMKTSPEVFVSHSWPPLQGMMKEWLAPSSNGRLLGLHLACNLCEHLGEQAVAVWPVFMEAVLAALTSQEAGERQMAAFAILLASQVPAFGAQYGDAAFKAVASSLQTFKAKKNDDDGQRARDNVVAALVQLCLSQPGVCPDLPGCWQAALGSLPMKVDLGEAKHVNRKLFLEVQKPGGGALQDMARVAQVLGYLCDVYGKSELCDDDLGQEFARSFASLPQATLESLLPQLSQKQQKKAERVLRDGRAIVSGSA